jgi:hypothetical protein
MQAQWNPFGNCRCIPRSKTHDIAEESPPAADGKVQ